MHALQCQHDVDVHLLFCFDIDLHLACSQVHGFSSSILTDRYHFACSAQQTLYHFNKLSCIYCNAYMIYIYMYTYFVLTSINLICSCFVHAQQHAPPSIAMRDIPVTTGACLINYIKNYILSVRHIF